MTPDTEAAAARSPDPDIDPRGLVESAIELLEARKRPSPLDISMACDLLRETLTHLAPPAPAAGVGEVTDWRPRIAAVEAALRYNPSLTAALQHGYGVFAPVEVENFTDAVRMLTDDLRAALAAAPPVPPAVAEPVSDDYKLSAVVGAAPDWTPDDATEALYEASLLDGIASHIAQGKRTRIGGDHAYRTVIEDGQCAVIRSAADHLRGALAEIERFGAPAVVPGWRPIGEPPISPCGVLLYYPIEDCHPDCLPGQSYAVQVAFWNGRFLEQGTAHDIFDETSDRPEDRPTMWQPLASAPEPGEAK